MGPNGESPSTGGGDQCGAYQEAGLDDIFNTSCGGQVSVHLEQAAAFKVVQRS